MQDFLQTFVQDQEETMEQARGATGEELARADRRLLAAIVDDLSVPNISRRLKAVVQLRDLKSGNVEALKALERRATGDQRREVRVAALSALASPTYREISCNSSRLPPVTRRLILSEIDQWVKDGVLPGEIAEVMRGRYARLSKKLAS